MPRHHQETGITNLGLVPRGMTFAEAILASAPQRKYHINPYEGGHRLTLCDTIRNSWQLVDKLPDGPEKQQLYENFRAMFDFGKRMDARMKELKALLERQP